MLGSHWFYHRIGVPDRSSSSFFDRMSTCLLDAVRSVILRLTFFVFLFFSVLVHAH